MNGLNKAFISNPINFLNNVLIVTRPGPPCPTCQRPVDLSCGHGGGFNPFVRPEPTVLTFDLIGGAYLGGIQAGATFLDMLEGDPGAAPPIPAQPQAAGVGYPAADYATLLPMKMGAARANRPAGCFTTKKSAYWLPWSHQGSEELQLNDLDIKFFFTAMFSGCTFAVATPVSPGGQPEPENVWVTHIASDPGPALLPGWVNGPPAPGALPPAARRLVHEAAFYRQRLGAGQPIRSVTADAAPLIDGVLELGGGGLASNPIVNGAEVPVASRRINYGSRGAAFIVGWRGNNNAWNFAVQQQPVGTDNAGMGVAVPAPAGVVAVQQFY